MRNCPSGQIATPPHSSTRRVADSQLVHRSRLRPKSRTSMFVIWHRKPNSTRTDSSGVRIVIPYWLGWGPISFLVFWNLMNIQMGYWQWQNISSGVIGPLSRDKLHLSEIFAVLGLSVLLWITTGREVITLDANFLRVRREIFGIGWSQQYPLTEVSEIRTGCFLDPKAGGKWSADHTRAAFNFSYRGKIRSFAKELRTEDALEVEKVLHSFRPSVTAPD
jgi:hypothetical protein